MKKLKAYFDLLKKSGQAFVDDNALKLSASLSYYMVFAMGPIILIVITLAGYFFGKDAVQGKVYAELSKLLGAEAALQIELIIRNTASSHDSTVGTTIGIIALFLGATGVFGEIQDSINYIWSVKAKPRKGWLRFIINRLLSFSIVISMGFILLVALVINALMEMLSERLIRLFSEGTIYVFYSVNLLLIFLVITVLFAAIFKILPDASIRWKDAFIGAAFTSVLFLFGKFLIGYYLGTSNIGIVYGTAASIIFILLWVYYSSVILYFGAEFTRMYAIRMGGGIHPDKTAVFIIKKEAREIPESHLDT
ncbi:MAG TPA: YihY/virulence factor BrkB family protein [Chitinophagaceae bacterium]|nr:YihY/virulence factor BrkB family protein [Chitinophagaceae bacterium]